MEFSAKDICIIYATAHYLFPNKAKNAARKFLF